jgi:epoxyqueuosine reductase
MSREQLIKSQAYALGFDLVGITTLGEVETHAKFANWVGAGYAGEMHYLERGLEKRRDTRSPFSDVKSAIVVGLDYGGRAPSGPVARYARSDDYHDVMIDKLNALHRWIESTEQEPVKGKPYVDTGPILERDLARKAGLGWFGKNTMLVNQKAGSFFFLGALLLDIELTPDAPFESDRCGTCTRCIDACPTGALESERVLNATKCISYLTIELRGSIPENLRAPMGELVYGCDICQDVCPWNVSFARESNKAALNPREDLSSPDLRQLLLLDDEGFRSHFRKSPIKRTKRRGLARNIAVAMGNSGDSRYIPDLEIAARDADPVVSEHAAWALDKLRAQET